MARIHDLTPDQRALVLLLRHEFGYSYREIALKTKMSKTSVFRIIKHFDCSNTRGKKLKKAYQGRHKSLIERDERKLKRAIMQLRERSPNFTVMEVVQRSGRYFTDNCDLQNISTIRETSRVWIFPKSKERGSHKKGFKDSP